MSKHKGFLGFLYWLTWTLLIIGGLNWLLISVANWDLVMALGWGMTFVKIVYFLVGASALAQIVFWIRSLISKR